MRPQMLVFLLPDKDADPSWRITNIMDRLGIMSECVQELKFRRTTLNITRICASNSVPSSQPISMCMLLVMNVEPMGVAPGGCGLYVVNCPFKFPGEWFSRRKCSVYTFP